MSKPIENGEICFSEDGEEFEFIEKCERGSIVRRAYDHDDGPSFGDSFLFAGPLFRESEPSPKWHKRIAELQQQERELRETVSGLRIELNDAQRESKKTALTLANNEAVKDLAAFIRGEAKFLAFNDYKGWKILPMEEALAGQESRGDLRLLSLYGRSKGELAWKRHHYSDGSGSDYKEAHPFLTMEEARTWVLAQITASANSWLELKTQNHQNAAFYLDRVTDQFAALDFEAPKWLAEFSADHRAKEAIKTADKLRAEIADKQQKLAELVDAK